jgi:uncharacterized membrane protein YhaH (DUF805 family)
MSKPVFQDIFRFSGRRNRKSYFLFGVVSAVGLGAIWGIALGLSRNGEWTMMVLAGLLTIPAAVASWAVAAQRCRDFGWTGWAILLTLIPYLGALFALVILFIPGTAGPNRYGPDPLGSGPAQWAHG